MIDQKWFHAQLNLTKHVIYHALKYLIPWRQKTGLKLFKANYVEEGLPSFTKAHRDIGHKASKCTTCGLCDARCPKYANNEIAGFIGPMRMVASGFRGGTNLLDIESQIEVMLEEGCQDCKLCEVACPEQIPIIELSEHFSQQIQEIKRLR